jgi:hypothetical protein
MTQRHSATVEALIDVSDRLTAAAFPPHPTTARLPKAGAGTDRIETADEWIDLATRVQDTNASIEWARIGEGAPGRRDERFWIDVHIQSTVPGKSRTEVLERIADLTAVVEGMFYDETTGQHVPVGVGRPWASGLGGIRQVVPQAWRTPEGWIADCVVSVAVAARI